MIDHENKTAVAFESGKPLEIVEVDLEGPKAGEVLVEIKATGSVIPMHLPYLAMTLKALFRLF